ncbi:TlpA disulfide reductase family protein, partial [Hoeflea sp. BAL378]|uniref:thiol:disulfide interchange protein TlpA n=1 Tax=Hoeflea sp. BAL378 TaxID=1547437 RepID=UPI001FCC11F5
MLARLKPLARGEVAAMTVREDPISLPQMSFLAADGTTASLADFTGQAMLVNLWATWCAPCREEMPALSELERELGDDAFKVLAINIDTGDVSKPQAFLDEIGVANLGLYRDASMDVFNILKREGLAFGLPVTLMIGKDGCLLGAMNGPAEWASDDAKALIAAL